MIISKSLMYGAQKGGGDETRFLSRPGICVGICLQAGMDPGGGRPPPLFFKKRLKNMYNFVKK
jgi:hypothetical protein